MFNKDPEINARLSELLIPCLQFEKGILICDIHQLIITLATPIRNNSQGWVSFLAIFSHNSGIIVRISCKKMLRVVVGVYDYFSKCIMHMYILTSLTDKMLQKLCKQLQPISENST